MKKIKLLGLGVIVAAAALSVTMNMNFSAGVNAICLENVEALATGESTSGGCYGTGSVVCDHGTYYGKWY